MIGLPKCIYLNTKWTSSKIFSRQEELDLRRCPTTRPRGDEERRRPPPAPRQVVVGGGAELCYPPGGAHEGGACLKQQHCQRRPQQSQAPTCLAQEVEVPWRYGAIPFDA